MVESFDGIMYTIASFATLFVFVVCVGFVLRGISNRSIASRMDKILNTRE